MNPDHLQARILLGDVRIEQEKFGEAAVAYEKAYRQDKQQVGEKLREAKAKWADSLHKDGEKLLLTDPPAALKIYEIILKINPDDSEAKEAVSDLQQLISKLRRRKLFYGIGVVITLAVFTWVGYIIVTFGFEISDFWTKAAWTLLVLAGGMIGLRNSRDVVSGDLLSNFLETLMAGAFFSVLSVLVGGGLVVLAGRATLWLFDSYNIGFFVLSGMFIVTGLGAAIDIIFGTNLLD